MSNKKLLFLFSAIIISSVALGQEREKGTIEVSPYLGYHSSSINNDDVLVADYKTRTSVSLGVLGDYYLNDRWSLRSGLVFSPMGGRPIDSDDSNPTLKMNYLNIPINANWHFGSTRKWNLNFGLSNGILTKASIGDLDVKDDLKGYLLNLNFGIGYKFKISENFGIRLDFQGLFSLSDPFDEEEESDIYWLSSGGSYNVAGVFKF